MKYPGYKTARVMTNKDGMTPSDLALTAGHESLSEKIRRTECGSDYEEIHEDSGYLTFGSEEHDEYRSRARSTGDCRYWSLPTPCLDRDSGIHESADSLSEGNTTFKPRTRSEGGLKIYSGYKENLL
uniref:Uncharacterized protein LOC111121241 n=1 Tax=Crassostrea virginica TaxID=6565 RepID=A0A8B8CQN0_CRAVI|nr:uncharacterized protein LOC111121241 [Crassostrea virginica]